MADSQVDLQEIIGRVIRRERHGPTEQRTFHTLEIPYGRFERSLRLPEDTDTAAARPTASSCRVSAPTQPDQPPLLPGLLMGCSGYRSRSLSPRWRLASLTPAEWLPSRLARSVPQPGRSLAGHTSSQPPSRKLWSS